MSALMPAPPATEEARASFGCLPKRAQVVLQAVASHYEIDDAVVLDRTKVKIVADARRAVCTLLREHGYTAAEIARMLGRDHSTIVFNISRGKKFPPSVLENIRISMPSYVRPEPLPLAQVCVAVRSWAERVVPDQVRAAILSYVEGVLLGVPQSYMASPARGLMVLASTPDLRKSLATVFLRCGLVDTERRMGREIEKSGWGAR